MMPRKVLVSGDAQRDIETICTYISQAAGQVIADKIFAAIEEKIRGLLQFADRGNWPKELAMLGITEYRELHFKPYRIIYTVGKDVTVYAVLDGRRDMDALLRRRLVR
jgi:toxin ParE1/3/4